MKQIDADYLGGLPEGLASCEGGALAISGGGLAFTGRYLGDALQMHSLSFTIDGASIRAVSVGETMHMQMLGRMIQSAARSSGWGLFLGATTRDHVMMVAVHRGGTDFIASFGVRGDHGPGLLRALQADRAARGGAPFPRLEELDDIRAEASADRHLRALEDIRELLAEQNRLIGRLVSGRTDPPPG